MDLKQVKEILKKIDVHYGTDRSNDDYVIKEWFNILKEYEYLEVLEKFESHLKTEMYGQYYPKVHNLIKFLTKIKDKTKINNETIFINCRLCNKRIQEKTFDNHYDRCLSISTIKTITIKYFNRELTIEKLEEFQNMSNDDFNNMYIKFLEKSIIKVPDRANFYRNIINAINGENTEKIQVEFTKIKQDTFNFQESNEGYRQDTIMRSNEYLSNFNENME